MTSSSKRNRSTSDANTSSKKFKSAKDVAKDTSIVVDVPEQKTSDEDDPYWELSVKRRITIQEFKGTTLVGIREFYEKDGKTLPGKSGISLTPEQFAILLKAAPAIKVVLAKKGIDIRDQKEEDEEHDEDDAENPGGNGSEEEAEVSDHEDED